MTLKTTFETLAKGQDVKVELLTESTQAQLLEYGLVPVNGVFSTDNFELLNATAIRSQLRNHTDRWLRWLKIMPCTQSTNTDLLNVAQRRAIDGTAITVEVQTQGRGRRGRSWVSPFGQNVALSVGVKVDRPAAEIGALSLAIGLGVAVQLEQLGLKEVGLKWPNDVLIGTRKVGGILLELATTSQPTLIVVGIGLNVNAAPGIDVTGDYQATSLVDHMQTVSRNEIVTCLLEAIHETAQEFERAGFESFRSEWQVRDYLFQRDVELLVGGDRLGGVGAGVDEDGAYLIQTPTDLHRAIGGNLRLRVAAD